MFRFTWPCLQGVAEERQLGGLTVESQHASQLGALAVAGQSDGWEVPRTEGGAGSFFGGVPFFG